VDAVSLKNQGLKKLKDEGIYSELKKKHDQGWYGSRLKKSYP
jgi:hypothetical protein